MSDNCDKCGLDDSDCMCYIFKLEDRIETLEEELDKLTQVVKKMSDYVRLEDKWADEE